MNEDRRKAEGPIDAPTQHWMDGIYEDELPDGYPYDLMFPFSWLDGVRIFPCMEFANALRQARLEENKACEEICLRNCARVCTASIIAIAKRREGE